MGSEPAHEAGLPAQEQLRLLADAQEPFAASVALRAAACAAAAELARLTADLTRWVRRSIEDHVGSTAHATCNTWQPCMRWMQCTASSMAFNAVSMHAQAFSACTRSAHLAWESQMGMA